jgi:hypothetical protein
VEIGTSQQQGIGELVGLLEAVRASTCNTAVSAVLDVWRDHRFQVDDVAGWGADDAAQGLVVLENVTRSIDALKTVLVGCLDAGRDATASIVRKTGMSYRAARQLHAASKIVDQHPDALHKLSTGELSAEHLATLAPLPSDLAAELLGDADGKSADEFKKHVATHRVRHESKTVSEEQHNSRSVKFFTKPNGCIGATIILPPVEGTEFKTIITDLCDRAWKTKHPERAEVLGGHTDEPYERRLADAVVEFMHGAQTTGKPSVIVMIDAETLEAHIVPEQPIPLNDALTVMAHADVYAAIRDGTDPARLVFGRNKRVATELQKLAMLVFGETCDGNGCNVSALESDAHHVIWYRNGGNTNLDNLKWKCRGGQGHHQHEHETG